MATMEQLERALINADKAGDAESAKVLAGEISRMRQQATAPAQQAPQQGGVDPRIVKEGVESGSSTGNALRSFVAGMVPFADEAIAAASASAYPLAADAGLVPKWDADWNERYKTSRAIETGREAKTPYGGLYNAAGGVAASLTPLGAIGQAIGRPLTAANLGRSALAGAGWGTLFAAGEGDGALDRLSRAPVGAAIGALSGVGGNVAQEGIGRIAQALTGPDKAGAQALGVKPETYRLASRSARMADQDVPGGAASFIRQGGQDAMLGDIMPQQLDAYANMGAGAPIARANLNTRADAASGRVNQALDDTLGGPQGLRQSAREISRSTTAGRKSAYDAAYDFPLDYSTAGAGNKVLDALQYITPEDLKAAKALADKKLINRYGPDAAKYKQWKINFEPDGSVTYETMPSVRELDMLKRALDEMAERKDIYGRAAEGVQEIRDARNRIREALKDATTDAQTGKSVYGQALESGEDKIAQDQALDLGRRLLSPAVTKEMAEEGGRGMSNAERQRLAQGVRAHLDEMLGNIRMARSDPNLDHREAWTAIQSILTRNNQEKLRATIGQQEADALFGELRQAARAFNVRANAAPNSATAGRQTERQALQEQTGRGRIPDRPITGAIDFVQSIPTRAVNAFTGRTAGQIQRREDVVARQMAELLTGRRGQSAVDAFNTLINPPQAQPQYQDVIAQALARGSRLGIPPAVSPLIQQ